MRSLAVINHKFRVCGDFSERIHLYALADDAEVAVWCAAVVDVAEIAAAGTVERPAVVDLDHEDAPPVFDHRTGLAQRQKRAGQLANLLPRGEFGERKDADAVDVAHHDCEGIAIGWLH